MSLTFNIFQEEDVPPPCEGEECTPPRNETWTAEEMSEYYEWGTFGLLMHGVVGTINTVAPILLYFLAYDGDWTFSFWWTKAWNLAVVIFPSTWGPVVLFWLGIILFESPLAMWSLSLWIWMTFIGGVAGLLPGIFFLISWINDEGGDKDLFWWIFGLTWAILSGTFTTFFGFPTMHVIS